MKMTALLIVFITIISKIIGFGREITLSYFYGASNISDAFLIAITIPGVIFSFIVTGLAAGFIPMYSNVLANMGSKEANRFTSNLINIIVLFSTSIVFFGLINTEHLVKIFASGFDDNLMKLTVEFTRICLFAIYFSGVLSVALPFLQVNGNYIVPAMIGLPMNIIIIISIFLSTRTNISGLAIGYLFSIVVQLLFVIPFLKRLNYSHKISINFKDPHIKEMGILILPLILSVSVNQINILIDKTLASRLAIGGISALNYANKLNGFVQSIFVLSIATVLYPSISKYFAEDNIQGFKKSISEAVTVINLFIIPATLGSIIFARPIVTLLFGRGAFDINAISMTSSALIFYSIGMIGFGLRDILTRAFFSMKDTKTPTINGVIGVIINIVLNLILSKILGISGLALATSISAIITTVLLFWKLRNKIGPFGIKEITKSFIKIIFSTAIMGITCLSLFKFLLSMFGSNFSLIVSIIAGFLIYILVISFMKISDVDAFIRIIKIKLKNTK